MATGQRVAGTAVVLFMGWPGIGYKNSTKIASSANYRAVFSNRLIINLLCGDGRSRTAVQTESQVAFYTLILSLIVGPELPEGRPLRAYPLKT